MDSTYQSGQSATNDYDICCIALQKIRLDNSRYRVPEIWLKVHANPVMSLNPQGYFFCMYFLDIGIKLKNVKSTCMSCK